MGEGSPAARQRKVTIWARVQVPSGEKESAEVPAVIPRPTGIAQVTLDEDGTPTYELVRDVAYDFIPFPPALRQAHPFDAIYFGTLAQRNPLPRATLYALLELTQGALRFCDLNLRQGFYNRDVVEGCLKHVNMLKISRDEANVFHELGLSDIAISGQAEDVQTLGRDLHSRYPNIRELLLTLDKDGASVWLAENDEVLISEKPSGRVVSTVGGGDSFGACYLFNRLSGASPSLALKRGQVLAGFVVTQLGAVPQYPSELYKRIK